jgi:predicted dehydrogenase
MNKQTGVIVGCGTIAREHLVALQDLKDVEVAAVCDISPIRAEATADRFGVTKWYSDYLKMLADIKPDLVHIATPPLSHYQIAKNCLAAGLNILCEKPIAATYQEFIELKQSAGENRCVLMENQNLRFAPSVLRLEALLTSGAIGDLLDVQVCYSLDINGPKSPYTDSNAPHFALALRGSVIGDFLPHIAYLAQMFIGRVQDLRTIWSKHRADSIIPVDEFRAVIKGERASAYVAFIGNAQPAGLWLRLSGTRMHAEANLFLPPRQTLRRLRSGEPSVATLLDGIVEARDALNGSIGGFLKKLAGESSYGGLSELIARTYRSIELKEAQPIALDEIDDVARLVDSFTKSELKI